MTREPLLTTGTVAALVAAVVTLVVAFGADLTETQTAAILGVAAVLAPMLVGLVARSRVTPNSAVVASRQDGTGPVAGAASPLPDGTPVEVVNAELV